MPEKVAMAAVEPVGIPTPDTLIKRARALVPVLREREVATCDAGQVSAQTIQDFTDAGFFRVL